MKSLSRDDLHDLAHYYCRESGAPVSGDGLWTTAEALLMASRDIADTEITDADTEILASMLLEIVESDRAAGRGWAEAEWEATGDRTDYDRTTAAWTASDLSGLDYTSPATVRDAAAHRWEELQREEREALAAERNANHEDTL